MSVDKSLISGSMTMLILKLLDEKDMYGYEMIDTLRQRSQNVFELKAGTLYPLLHGLESDGYLTVYEQEFLGKTRKYYSITKSGRGLLKQKQTEWNTYQTAVSNVLACLAGNGSTGNSSTGNSSTGNSNTGNAPSETTGAAQILIAGVQP